MLNSELIERIVFVNAHSDASEGAAENVLSLLFRIPQVGETGNEIMYNKYLLMQNI